MGWSKKYKRSIDCNNPKGFSQKAHCAGKVKKENVMKLEELVGKPITEEQFDEAAGKKDACYHKVKARYDVWPSAYASGALVKCRKVGAANWGKSKKEGMNEASMELKKLEDAIKMFQKKIKKQGRVTNARDEDHLENLIKIYKQMGGKKIKEAVKLKGKSGMGKISHLGVPQPSKGVEKLFKIADKGFDKVGGVTVDGMSASLFKQIYNKANDDIKNKLNKKSEKELVRIIGRMWDKFGKNVKIGSSL